MANSDWNVIDYENELRELVSQFLKIALKAYNQGKITRKQYIAITDRKCRYMYKINALSRSRHNNTFRIHSSKLK